MKRLGGFKTSLRPAQGLNMIAFFVILGLIALNIACGTLENKFALTSDLTGGELYTLSRTSLETLDGLEEDIHIYTLYSPGNRDAVLEQLLYKYAAASLRIQVKDMKESSSLYESMGYTLSGGKDGIIIANEDNTLAKFISETELYIYNQDYDPVASKAEAKITSAIYGIIEGAFARVQLLTGHGEAKTTDIRDFLQMLDIKNFTVSTYNFAGTGESLNPETDILLIISPKTDLLESEYAEIVEFLSLGGRVMAFMDNAAFSTEQGILQVYKNSFPAFDSLFRAYNLKINSDLVVASDLSVINLRPTSIIMQAAGHPILSYVSENNVQVVMSETSSILAFAESQAAVFPLLYTPVGCYSKEIDGTFSSLKRAQGDAEGPFVVAALSELKDSKLLVFTDSLIIKNDAFSIPGNKLLLESSVNYMNPTGRMVNISSKPFSQMARSAKAGYKLLLYFINVIALPVLCILSWFYMSGRRRRRRKPL